MIITFITIGIIIGAILFWIIDYFIDKYWSWNTAFILTVTSMYLAAFVGFALLCGQFNREVRYQNTLYEKQTLEYRIENMDENIVGNEMLYKDVTEFNKDLRNFKKWGNNPWTNWFFNQDIAKMDYIEWD